MKKKFVFIGDIDSINIEIISKSHKFLKNKVNYILFGNINDLSKYLKRVNCSLKINEIFNPLSFNNYKIECLNIFNIENLNKEKYINLINQINIANHFAKSTNLDLVTLPIDKSIFKKKIEFTGMTEYLGKINQKKTVMLMHGEKFSVIPLTTHINLNEVGKFIKKNLLNKFLKEVLKQINNKIYGFDFKDIRFLCYNPHCSENNTLGNQDKIISNSIYNLKEISGPYAADSAFKDNYDKTLYISMYHDQVLIPFKILNKKGINITLGLNYKRLSPSHGTAKDIKFKNIANISSYIACMQH